MALLTAVGTCTFSPILNQSHWLKGTSSGSSPFVTSSRSVSVSVPSKPIPVICGRGDNKTKKGKRYNHSWGNARPRDKTKGTGPPRAPTPFNPYKKRYEQQLDASEFEKLEQVESIPDMD
ncbi:small ribosomal subunit protein bTHXc-like [Carex rostrata]